MKLQFVPISKTKISDPGEKPWTIIIVRGYIYHNSLLEGAMKIKFVPC